MARRKVSEQIVSSLDELSAAFENGEKISKKFRCRRIVLDLVPQPYKASDAKRARDVLGVSQSVFAQFLGVTTSTVCAWEQGKNRPSDIACRFMDEIQRDPPYWRKRLADAVSVTAGG